MPNLNLIKKYNRVHMLGIGGVSMSGIAEILNYFGVTVTGSDLADSEIVKKLQKNGIPVTIGHDFENLSKADIVVYSAAINSSFHLSVFELNLNLYTHQIPLCQVSLSRAKCLFCTCQNPLLV